ncbi:GtrA family protein [Erysipelotrichaceae bacterium RD49]|nr:GtrA family protein [Erysipelotrichaceae bacterium RD49]
METILNLFKKYKELITYGFWGVVATVVNIGTYHVCYDVMAINNTASNLIAWVLAMLVAFVTNKLFVFNRRHQTMKQNLQEFVSFAGFRLVSEVFDLGIMIWAVDLMHMNAMFWKIVANVIVIALNYIFSKFIIFKKPSQEE